MVSTALPPAATKNRPREIFAWCMYDWANSAYSTIYITVLVLYLQGAVLKGDAGLTAWGWGIGITTLLSAILSPLLGAIADAHANKRTWLAITTMLGASASALMFFGTPERPWFFVAMFLIANLNYELVQSFYNAFLPEVADDRRMSEVSAWGYGAGYVGGGLMLVVAILLLKYGESWGLPADNYFLPRLCLLVMGLWWAVFSLPILLVVRDKSPPRVERRSFLATAIGGLQEVRRTLLDIRRYQMLAIFLVGFLIFNDGVMTVISQASVFAKHKFEMKDEDLIPVFLMIQFVALPGAVVLGWLANKIGQKRALHICLSVWVIVLVSGFLITEVWQFWCMAALTALVMGGTQSVSRTIMGLMTPESRTGEFFGFFNLSGKAFSMLGPIMFTEILKRTGSANWAILSLLVFFAVGWAIIAPLDIARGQRQARAEPEPAL
ncbi:MAG TPA: MFS transporter [Pirellulales bacterium]|nr:MFS transporter [Pirellulales bacterium]